MITPPPRTTPVPDAVAALSGRLLPPRILAAVTQGADAARLYAACRGRRYAEARQQLEARIRVANKVLGAANPGLIIGWAYVPVSIPRSV